MVKTKEKQNNMFGNNILKTFFYTTFKQVGAPPEIACLLEEIQRESHLHKQNVVPSSSCFGADPELDEFMVSIYLALFLVIGNFFFT